MMPHLANYLLKENIVQGVLTVRFKYTDKGPTPLPFIARSTNDLIVAQGSKYMPVPLLENINEVLSFPGELAVIGTPCQIAGLRLFQQENKTLKEKIKYTIANFCGGYRDYRETERIFKICKIKKEDITQFSYRGNGQPGTMSIQLENGTKVQLKYPEYARLTGYTKCYRCRLCVDATGELADISFGDAWIPRFLNSGQKWSVFISRSPDIDRLLKEMTQNGTINHSSISKEELINSQQGNLISKKERQKSRYKLYKSLGYSAPFFDGGYNTTKSNLLLELKVTLNHKLLQLLEIFGLYLFVAKTIKRVNKNNYKV